MPARRIRRARTGEAVLDAMRVVQPLAVRVHDDMRAGTRHALIAVDCHAARQPTGLSIVLEPADGAVALRDHIRESAQQDRMPRAARWAPRPSAARSAACPQQTGIVSGSSTPGRGTNKYLPVWSNTASCAFKQLPSCPTLILLGSITPPLAATGSTLIMPGVVRDDDPLTARMHR